MSYLDDVCDFCNKYTDPMGNDKARVMKDRRFWCGHCEQGLLAKYDYLTNQELDYFIEKYSTYLEENPLWPHKRADDGSWLEEQRADREPDSHQLHMRKLDISDALYDMMQLKRMRENVQSDS